MWCSNTNEWIAGVYTHCRSVNGPWQCLLLPNWRHRPGVWIKSTPAAVFESVNWRRLDMQFYSNPNKAFHQNLLHRNTLSTRIYSLAVREFQGLYVWRFSVLLFFVLRQHVNYIFAWFGSIFANSFFCFCIKKCFIT